MVSFNLHDIETLTSLLKSPQPRLYIVRCILIQVDSHWVHYIVRILPLRICLVQHPLAAFTRLGLRPKPYHCLPSRLIHTGPSTESAKLTFLLLYSGGTRSMYVQQQFTFSLKILGPTAFIASTSSSFSITLRTTRLPNSPFHRDNSLGNQRTLLLFSASLLQIVLFLRDWNIIILADTIRISLRHSAHFFLDTLWDLFFVYSRICLSSCSSRQAIALLNLVILYGTYREAKALKLSSC